MHVWGVDYAATEQLVNDIAIALGLAAQGSLLITAGGFVSRTENLQCGREYVMTIQLAVPVVKPTLATAPTGVKALHIGIMGDTVAC